MIIDTLQTAKDNVSKLNKCNSILHENWNDDKFKLFDQECLREIDRLSRDFCIKSRDLNQDLEKLKSEINNEQKGLTRSVNSITKEYGDVAFYDSSVCGFDGKQYSIRKGHVVNGFQSNWGSEPFTFKSTVTRLQVVGEKLYAHCADGSIFEKKHGCGWSRATILTGLDTKLGR